MGHEGEIAMESSNDSENRVVMGPFEVDPSGTLFPRDGDAPPCFHFTWRDRAIEAQLRDNNLYLLARVGRVPSSATAQPRPPAFEALRSLPRNLPANWKISLAASHAVQIEINTRLEDRLTAAHLIAAITSHLLELAPYLDVLQEAGVGLAN